MDARELWHFSQQRTGRPTRTSFLKWLRSLAALFVAAVFVFNASAQTCVPLPAGVIAWWPFDEAQGTIATDVVGGNHGTYVGAPQPAAGLVNGALRFNGVDSYIVVPDSDLWAFGASDFTLEFWANFDVPPHGTAGHPGDVFLSHDNGPFNVDKWIFALSSTALEFITGVTATGSGTFSPVAPFALQVGRWYHIALTRSGTNYQIYVDSVPIPPAGTNLAVIPNPASPLTIGAALEPLGSGMGFGGVMNGRLDEVTIYRRALSQAELQAIAAAGSAGKCKVLQIATKTLPAVELGQFSSTQLQRTGGQGPFSWSIISGSLPSGMTLSSVGLVSGTPTEAGEFTLTVAVRDAAGASAEKQFVQQILLTSPAPSIRVQITGTAAVPGRLIDYFIIVENTGSIEARDVEVMEALPSSLSLQSMSPAGTADLFTLAADSLVHWVLPVIPPGEAKLLTYRARLDPATPIGRSLSGQVYAKAYVGGPTLGEKWGECGQTVIELVGSESCHSCLPTCHIAATVCAAAPESIATVLPCLRAAAACFACLAKPDPTDPEGQSCLQRGASFLDKCLSAAGTSLQAAVAFLEQLVGRPIDPNEKIVSRSPYIRADQLLLYPIHFENVGTVEARDVFVTDVLDPNLDESTVTLLTEGASFDTNTRTIKWSLLNRNLQPGESGNVLLSARPRGGLPSGTEIRNKALIQFEIFQPITTNEVVSIIDDVRPNCLVNPLPSQTPTPDFAVSWRGADAVGQIDTYSVWVSVDGGSFSPLLENTKDTSTTFRGVVGKRYGFLCVARDTAGNVEIQRATPEAQTRVVPPNAPPSCGTASPSLGTLWPPNHAFVPIAINGVSDPDGDQVVLTITSVTQDEPVNGLGDGDASPDAIVQGSQISLRAERSGIGNGRVYRVGFVAADGRGGSCEGSVRVDVPHSDNGVAAVDDGQRYNSLGR